MVSPGEEASRKELATCGVEELPLPYSLRLRRLRMSECVKRRETSGVLNRTAIVVVVGHRSLSIATSLPSPVIEVFSIAILADR